MDMMVYGKSEQKQYSGKNLFDKSTSKSAWISDDGIYSEKGEIGENTDVVSIYIGVKQNSTYIASFKTNYSTSLVYWCTYNANKEFASIIKNANKITIPTGIRYVRVMISLPQQYCVAVNDELQVELGTESTAYEPYTGGQPSPSPDYPQEIKSVVNPTVKVCGENLYPGSDLIGLTKTYTTDFIPVILHKGKIYFSFDTSSDTSDGRYHINAKYFDINKELMGGNGNESIAGNNISHVSFEFDGTKAGINHETIDLKNVSYVKIMFGIYATTATKITYKNIMISATDSDFEPYKPIQTVTLPYTLNAIPVSAGGNVTIDGQQYIADYMDVERGKLIRMVDSSKLDNTQSIIGKTEWLLAEQQETDLTTEQTQALKELATYYPVTNISVNSEQLDGYTVFNYPISMKNGWDYVKKQINDNRDYIYNMDTKTQDIDTQAAEAYVNSEYAVALTELEV